MYMQTYPVLRDSSKVELPISANYKRRSGPNKDYGGLLEAIQSAAGDWIAITDSDLVAGPTLHKKVVCLHTAARWRGMLIQTTCQHNRIYVRLAGAAAKPAARVVA
jgi:hypothetical protein